MSALAQFVTVSPVTEDLHEERHRAGLEYRSRRTEMGMSVSALAKAAGVDRGSLTALESGHEVRDTTIAAVEKALRELEHEMGMDEPTQAATEPSDAPAPGFIRYRVEGVYGARALIVEGPVENMAELEASMDRIMRRISGDSQG